MGASGRGPNSSSRAKPLPLMAGVSGRKTKMLCRAELPLSCPEVTTLRLSGTRVFAPGIWRKVPKKWPSRGTRPVGAGGIRRSRGWLPNLFPAGPVRGQPGREAGSGLACLRDGRLTLPSRGGRGDIGRSYFERSLTAPRSPKDILGIRLLEHCQQFRAFPRHFRRRAGIVKRDDFQQSGLELFTGFGVFAMQFGGIHFPVVRNFANR